MVADGTVGLNGVEQVTAHSRPGASKMDVRGSERGRPTAPLCFVIHFLTLPNTSAPPSVLSSRLGEANALAQPPRDGPR
eukprot:scaffold22_cov401-Pavlova_lutheri.AAC.9